VSRRTRQRPPDPFAALGLTATPELTDDDVRAAWRRVAAATHPDRSDGGDPPRFAAAAGAYTELRTRFGRGEAMADAGAGTRSRFGRGKAAADPGHATQDRRARFGRGKAEAALRTDRHRPPAARRGNTSTARFSWQLRRAIVLLPARVRRGRPGRLALRALAAAVASAATVAAVASQPAEPALITGALTWLLLTARQDLAPPPE
jgi:curved DNA-binding protein CbpA